MELFWGMANNKAQQQSSNAVSAAVNSAEGLDHKLKPITCI